MSLKKDMDPKKLAKLPIVGRKPKSQEEEKHLREIEEYEFLNLESPGVSLTFTYGDTKNNASLILFHGGKYMLPRFIARHITSLGTPINKHKYDANNYRGVEKEGIKPRFSLAQVF